MLLLWPGYVYWARGQVKLALAAFQHALSHFECPSDHIVQGLYEQQTVFLSFNVYVG